MPHGRNGANKRDDGTARAPAPNIVIYLVDDAGWNLFNFGGAEPHNPDMLTPTVEALAQSGVVLDRHYTFVPVVFLLFFFSISLLESMHVRAGVSE